MSAHPALAFAWYPGASAGEGPRLSFLLPSARASHVVQATVSLRDTGCPVVAPWATEVSLLPTKGSPGSSLEIRTAGSEGRVLSVHPVSVGPSGEGTVSCSVPTNGQAQPPTSK